MKNAKRALALLLCLCMVLSYVPVHAHAAATETHVVLTVDKTEVQVGDTVIVTLGITDMTGTSVAFGFDFDKTLLEATSVTAARNAKLNYEAYDYEAEESFEDVLSPDAISTKAKVNESGHFGVAYAWGLEGEATYFENEEVITLKFTALKDGTVEFTVFEDTAGTDGYKDEWIHEITVTIGGSSEPECEHTSPSWFPTLTAPTMWFARLVKNPFRPT